MVSDVFASLAKQSDVTSELLGRFNSSIQMVCESCVRNFLCFVQKIPYLGPIYGGLREGMSVYIQGSTPEDITRCVHQVYNENTVSDPLGALPVCFTVDISR